MHICPNCEKQISRAAATECPHCGTRLGHTPPLSDGPGGFNRSKASSLILGISIAFFMFLLGISVLWRPPSSHDLLDYGADLVSSLAVIGVLVFVLSPIIALAVFVSTILNLIRNRLTGRKPLAKASVVARLVVSFCLFIFLAKLFYPVCIHPARESARRSACVNNLKQLGLVLNMYANENGGKFPPMDDTGNNFMFESDLLYPEYLSDVSILACPSDPETNPKANFRLISDHPDGTTVGEVHPDCITDMSYSYLGWMVMTDKETEAFFDAYDNMSPEDYDKDIIVPEGSGNAEGNVLHRLSQGVDRFLIPDTNILIQRDETILVGDEFGWSIVPIMWDQISTDIAEFSHVPAGQNVLYLDGRVDFYRYDLNSTQFPTSPLTASMFSGRPREPIPDCEE